MPLTRLLDYTLPLCMIGTILSLVFDLDAGAWLARIALLVYLLVCIPVSCLIQLMVVQIQFLLQLLSQRLFRFLV